MAAGNIRIHYRRPPDRLDVFEQTVIDENPTRTVTWMAEAGVRRPVTAEGRIILEPGAPVIWFTYPGLWHDIGRFHLRDGTFTGYYANILTPVVMEPDRWETTDLFLDLWLPLQGEPILLDEEELDGAEQHGWIRAEAARGAREQAARLLEAARAGSWPPADVRGWTLDRARSLADQSSS